MQKLSLLVAASVIGLGSAYSAMAQAPGGAMGEEPGRLIQDVPVERVAKVHHHALADARPGNQLRRHHVHALYYNSN